MTVRELIEMLGALPRQLHDREVVAWDPEAEEMLPVTGCYYDTETTVELSTDIDP